jgi:hypothetical protein
MPLSDTSLALQILSTLLTSKNARVGPEDSVAACARCVVQIVAQAMPVQKPIEESLVEGTPVIHRHVL